MSVERLPSGGWRARWRDASGKEHSKGSRKWRKRDAERYEREMLDQRDRGILADAGGMTVADLARLWMDSSLHYAESTKKTYERELRTDVLPALGHVRLDRLRASHIDAYLAKLAAAGRASTTQRRHKNSILSPMLTFAKTRRLIAVSPTADVRTPRLVETEKRFLSMDELRTLAAAFPDRWQNVILFTGVMGPRLSEVFNMRPIDIDGSAAIIRGTKSKSSLRRVTMPEFVLDIVQDQMKTWATPASLWPSARGLKPETGHWRDDVWTPALKRSGIGHMRFHDLRHTAAALAIRAGAHPMLLMRRLGHSSITVTLGTYGHLFPEADESIAGGLDEMWRNNGKEGDSND